MSNNDGKPSQPAGSGQNSSDSLNNSASRARNKTVMLTPEMTGKLRGMMSNDGASSAGNSASLGADKGAFAADQWQSPLKAQSLKPKSNPTSAPNDIISMPPAGAVQGSVASSPAIPVTPPAPAPATPSPAMPLSNANVAGAQAASPQPPAPSSPSLGGAMLGGAAAITGGAASLGLSQNVGAPSLSAPSSTPAPNLGTMSSPQIGASAPQSPLLGANNTASSSGLLSAVPLPSKVEVPSEPAAKMPNPAFSPNVPAPSKPEERDRKKTADLTAEAVAKSLRQEDAGKDISANLANNEPAAPSPEISSSLNTLPGSAPSDPLGFAAKGPEASDSGMPPSAPSASSSNGLNGLNGLSSVTSDSKEPETQIKSEEASLPKEVSLGSSSASTVDKSPLPSSSEVKNIMPRVFEQKTVGFLLSFDNDKFGEMYELSTGRWLLTSRPSEQDDYIFIDDKSISALHAIIRASDDGKIQILDQLSEFGTGLLRAGGEKEEDVSGTMITVNSGDVIRFGKRYFVVSLFPDAANKLSSSK